MFTGLVEACVPVAAIRSWQGGLELTVEVGDCVVSDVKPGDSLAINGVCLTVTNLKASRCTFQAVAETVRRTVLGRLKAGDLVHVERALRVGDRLGGHWVQGHVDGTGVIRSRESQSGQILIRVETDRVYTAYMVPKGSICVDGVSLTLVQVWDTAFSCAVIPETAKRTNLGRVSPGTPVNLEVDILAKYAAKLMNRDRGLSRSKLEEEGFG